MVEIYASVAIIMIPALAQFVFTVGSVQDPSGNANDPLLRLEIVNFVITPLFAPLATLIYSLRVQEQPAVASQCQDPEAKRRGWVALNTAGSTIRMQAED